MLLEPGTTCWRRETAGRAALLIDMADYFDAAMKAMRKARHTIHLLNWAFEPQTLFHPQPGCTGPEDDRIANFLKALARDNPKLDVRILCWKSALPVAATQNWFPLADRKVFAGTPVKFVLDGQLPVGACHHQKVLVIDDAIGFCGGGDIGPDRWDTPQHLDDDPRREKTRHAHGNSKDDFNSRHEVMGLVEGAPAKALGALFRDRWARATGEILPEPPATRPSWPAGVTAQFEGVEVGLSRTAGAWRGHPEVREAERLHLAAIAGATRSIYMENQYFTSPLIAAALARRLAEPDGPEVLLVGTEHSPSYFDQATMDRTRVKFIETLKRADRHGRFQAYSPVTTLGRIIIVHAKLTIIDDRLLRIGSANINNRSLGFDTECDMSFEAAGRIGTGARREIARLRTRLLAHWLGCDEAIVDAAIRKAGGLGAGVEALRNAGYARLRPILLPKVTGVAAAIAAYHLGDPFSPNDSWRPWRRKTESESAARRGRRSSADAAALS
ncbi:phospholipase D-like domain-containing protein [Phenylobacterium sp.]|uniref:phospholipase D-like domain-containing protein n=1 Tax=Phenylobacterium sp. TaxID=1871053 RepID=UPI0025F885D4|nr:phospholipase D-like domain-containing protein [Phenylobacterium sp.]